MIKTALAIFLFLVGLTTLLSLGIWQINRLEWKNAIITQLETQYKKDPLAHTFSFEELDLPLEAHDLRYGSVQGKFDFEKQIFLGPKPLENQIGYLVITPLKMPNGGYILVNRGWVAEDKKHTFEEQKNFGQVSVIGVFRKPDWNSFTPENSPPNNIWTKPDIAQIAKFKEISPIAPVLLYAETMIPPQSGLIPQAQKWIPRNKHKQYAIFWFGMAATFTTVFVIFGWNRRKKK